jgi:hypothetical protein
MGSIYWQTDLALHDIPNLFFVFNNSLVMGGLQLIELIHLALEHSESFTEAFQVW